MAELKNRPALQASMKTKAAEGAAFTNRPSLEVESNFPDFPPPPPQQNLVIWMMDDTGRSQMPMYDDLNRWPDQHSGDPYPYPSMPFLTSKAGTVGDPGGGVRFTQARVNPKCAPTRASIFTGRQSHITNLHDYGHGMGDVRVEQPFDQVPFYGGITAAQRPWPGVLYEQEAPHGTGMFGKHHCYAFFPSPPNPVAGDPLSRRINPKAIVDELGFEEGHEILRLGAGGPTYGFFDWPYTITLRDEDAGTQYEVQYAGVGPGGDPGTLPVDWSQIPNDVLGTDPFSPTFLYWKATTYIKQCVDAGKPFVIDWEMNLVHDLLPAVEPDQLLVDPANPAGVLTTMFTCYDYDGLIPDASGGNGETNAGGYTADGSAFPDYVFEDDYDDAPYGPEGQVHVEWRRTRACLEIVDKLAEKVDEYIRVNHPTEYAQTTFMHYSDNGALQRALSPKTTAEFNDPLAPAGDPYESCIPPTTSGAITDPVDPDEQYHRAEDAKQVTKDEGTLTPLIVWGTPLGAARGQDCARAIDAMDFYPTILDIVRPTWRDEVDAADLAKIDGESFYAALFNPTRSNGKTYTTMAVYAPAYVDSAATVLTSYDFSMVGGADSPAAAGYKLRRSYFGSGQSYEFFNLAVDPAELTDLRTSTVPADVAALNELLPAHQAFFGQPTI